MSALTITGFGLAVLFVTVSGILANSLRHRNKESLTLRKQIGARDSVIEDLRKANSKDEEKLKSLNSQLSLATIKTASLETKNRSLSVMAEKDRLEVANLKSRLSNCYERVGKRFQKVGKV